MRDLITPIVNRISKDRETLEKRTKDYLEYLAEEEDIYYDGEFFIGEGQVIENQITEPAKKALDLLYNMGVTIPRNDSPSLWEMKFENEI